MACVLEGVQEGPLRCFRDAQGLCFPQRWHCLELSQRFCRESQASERTEARPAVVPVKTKSPEPNTGSALPGTICDFKEL